MRSLSKTWNSLLSHPSFIKSHLDHSKDTNDEILLVFQSRSISKDIPVTAYISPNLQLANSVKVYMDSLRGFVVGLVNGLVCLESEECCTIWNPSLSASIDLPPYTIDGDSDSDYNYSDSDSDYNISYGDLRKNERFYYSRNSNFKFGFDPKKNDYKIVKLTYGYCNYDDRILHWLPVEVFSVLKGSWESITERFPSHVERILNMNEFVVDGYDGRLHYLCKVKISVSERTKVTIVAFDLDDETFSEIAFPDSIQYHRLRMELGVLSGKFCVMLNVSNGDCEVWVMENYGVATSWVKRHVIPKCKGDDIFPIGITLKNHFVLEHGNHRVLSLYDQEASTFKDFKGVKPFSSFTVVQYVDSLVWVTPAKWANNDVCVSSSQIEKKQHSLDD
uniref:F-box/kelch-repeat protein At3g06240-like n=1 Tax=Erigeron canadensis TaxID=72917 RepID=UPI001CB92C7C|nr:F-box/kelch-repeat protein At3g06240-like [Erigeron canadensis]